MQSVLKFEQLCKLLGELRSRVKSLWSAIPILWTCWMREPSNYNGRFACRPSFRFYVRWITDVQSVEKYPRTRSVCQKTMETDCQKKTNLKRTVRKSKSHQDLQHFRIHFHQEATFPPADDYFSLFVRTCLPLADFCSSSSSGPGRSLSDGPHFFRLPIPGVHETSASHWRFFLRRLGRAPSSNDWRVEFVEMRINKSKVHVFSLRFCLIDN